MAEPSKKPPELTHFGWSNVGRWQPVSPYSTCCHIFRATGITAYLENGGAIENAQAIAAHESPRTPTLDDRMSDEITLDAVERIAI